MCVWTIHHGGNGHGTDWRTYDPSKAERRSDLYACCRNRGNLGPRGECASCDDAGEHRAFCSVQGTVDGNHSGFTGSGFANAHNAVGMGVDWSVNVAAIGVYQLEWRYANGATSGRAE